MRANLFFAAALAALGGCQSITTVHKTPDRKEAADLLRRAWMCEEPDKPAPDAAAADNEDDLGGADDQADAAAVAAATKANSAATAQKCDPAAQPARVVLTTFKCEARPLRPGIAEEAYARCQWAGDIIRADGAHAPLKATGGDFSLLNMTPGAYRPILAWSYDPPSKAAD